MSAPRQRSLGRSPVGAIVRCRPWPLNFPSRSCWPMICVWTRPDSSSPISPRTSRDTRSRRAGGGRPRTTDWRRSSPVRPRRRASWCGQRWFKQQSGHSGHPGVLPGAVGRTPCPLRRWHGQRSHEPSCRMEQPHTASNVGATRFERATSTSRRRSQPPASRRLTEPEIRVFQRRKRLIRTQCSGTCETCTERRIRVIGYGIGYRIDPSHDLSGASSTRRQHDLADSAHSVGGEHRPTPAAGR